MNDIHAVQTPDIVVGTLQTISNHTGKTKYLLQDRENEMNGYMDEVDPSNEFHLVQRPIIPFVAFMLHTIGFWTHQDPVFLLYKWNTYECT